MLSVNTRSRIMKFDEVQSVIKYTKDMDEIQWNFKCRRKTKAYCDGNQFIDGKMYKNPRKQAVSFMHIFCDKQVDKCTPTCYNMKVDKCKPFANK